MGILVDEAVDWTDSSGTGEYGDADLSNGSWISSGSRNCSNTARLYGISPMLSVPLVVGDMNGDGSRNGLDIDAFILGLVDPEGFAQQYPGVDRICAGDTNRDGAFNGLDIDPFVDLLLS